MLENFVDRLHILETLCRKDFGISPRVALIVYICYIRPVIEYGCPAFLNLRTNQSNRLQILQNRALRLCLRAPRDTSLEKLHRQAKVDFVVPHLKLRTFEFIVKSMDNNTLCGADARHFLNDYDEEELKNTPLGIIRDMIS
jgi:hypothetical protein